MHKRALFGIACAIALLALPAHAQFMEVEKEPLPEPAAAKGPTADVTPVIAWIDPQVKCKGYLLCVHGLGLHKGTYQQFGERMSKLGWGVYAVDIRGFGSFQQMPLPEGKSRRVDFPGALEDVRSALEFVRKAHPGSPVFIVGESMGGAIALQTTANHPELVDGLISSVPAGERHHQLVDSVKVGLHMLAGPKRDMNVTKIVVDRSTQKEDLRDAWLQDSLGRFQLAPVELLEFQQFMNQNHKAAARITSTPVLMLQGHDDKLVKLKGNETLIEQIPSKDSVLVWVDKAEHLILEEGQFDDAVIDTVNGWLNEHVKAKDLAEQPSAAEKH